MPNVIVLDTLSQEGLDLLEAAPGISYEVRTGLKGDDLRQALAEFDGAICRSGVKITELRVSGGGSQSDAAMQLTADIFGLPTARPHIYETSGLGAAIDAAVGLGLYPDFGAAIKAMTRVGRVFHPIAANQEMYDRLYKNVYRKMYARLQPMYQQIAEITGYPKQV